MAYPVEVVLAVATGPALGAGRFQQPAAFVQAQRATRMAHLAHGPGQIPSAGTMGTRTRGTQHNQSAATADSALRQVLAAYAVLRDPDRRAAYDQQQLLHVRRDVAPYRSGHTAKVRRINRPSRPDRLVRWLGFGAARMRRGQDVQNVVHSAV